MHYKVDMVGDEKIIFYQDVNSKWCVSPANGIKFEEEEEEAPSAEPHCCRQNTIPNYIFNVLGDQHTRLYRKNGQNIEAMVYHTVTIRAPTKIIKKIKQELGLS